MKTGLLFISLKICEETLKRLFYVFLMSFAFHSHIKITTLDGCCCLEKNVAFYPLVFI